MVNKHFRLLNGQGTDRFLYNTVLVSNLQIAYFSFMNTSNPKFWAAVGFVVGLVMASGGGFISPLDVGLGGLIQSVIWFGVSSFATRRKKDIPISLQTTEISLTRKIIGGFFFFGGIVLLLNASFGLDTSSFAPGLFNLAIGVPTFWPVLKPWLNRIPFSK